MHAFTAFGSVCALFATLALIDGRYEAAFGWLFVALAIDAVDGTFARAVDVERHLARFSGERLDLVVDYMTYVFIPVLALLRSGLLAGVTGYVLAALILLSSLYHFADTESKTDDNYFVGFPAVWNLVAFCFFAWKPGSAIVALVTLGLVVLAFVPMRWLHPMRVERRFAANIAATVAGLVAAVWITLQGFPATPVPGAMLALAVVYFVASAVVAPRAR